MQYNMYNLYILSIFSLNIQSIYAKFNELEIFIEELNKISFKFNVICLQEIWILVTYQKYNCLAVSFKGKVAAKRMV